MIIWIKKKSVISFGLITDFKLVRMSVLGHYQPFFLPVADEDYRKEENKDKVDNGKKSIHKNLLNLNNIFHLTILEIRVK